MGSNLIVETEKVRDVAKEGKCPLCKEKAVITRTGSIGSGPGRPDGKLPETDKYTFSCRKCGKHFLIPISLYDEYK